jgi:protein-tyrosine kinase
MSLIEQALKRLQATVAPLPAAKAVPVATLDRSDVPNIIKVYEKRPIGTASRVLNIDMNALRLAGLLAPEHQERELAHQFRTIKRPLIKSAFEANRSEPALAPVLKRSIMVTSPLAGDGKTFTSVNLALSLAREHDYSVLLVDGDVAKPHISKAFGAGDDFGLLDVLADASRPIESVVMPTSIAGLSLLPVGRRSDAATELLASARMRAVVERLEQLDPQLLVVVDSPPILLTSEARVLASLFGQVVLVVRAGITPQHAVTEAIRAMGEAPNIRLVLNEAVHAAADDYYGYGYGHSNGDGRSDSGSEP